ncbi:MAG: CreA family protein [Sneathiellaceae bacterium]
MHRIDGRRIAAATRFMAALALALLAVARPVAAEEIGSVDTAWKLIGPNHKIVIEAFDDPDVPGVACHVSRSRKGGTTGWLGLAEETSDASIACRQVGPIALPMRDRDGKQVPDLKRLHDREVFSEGRSPIFKALQVRRFWDPARRTLVYLVYSDKLIDGSPKNAISTVPVMPWGPPGGG